MGFKYMTIGIWRRNADGPLSVVTAMGVTLLKFCQLLAINYNRNNQFDPSLYLSTYFTLIMSVTFPLAAAGRDFFLLLEPFGTLRSYIPPIDLLQTSVMLVVWLLL